MSDRYRDPALSHNILREIQYLRRRLDDLERGHFQLDHSSISGDGKLIVVDANNREVARLGAFDTGDQGLAVRWPSSATTLLWVSDDDGFVAPWIALPWRHTASYYGLNTGTWTTMYTARTELLVAKQISFVITYWVDASTTIELRVKADTDYTDTISRSGGGSGTWHDDVCSWIHGITLPTSPVTFELQGRRTVGTGSGHIYVPEGLHMGKGFDNASTGGWVA